MAYMNLYECLLCFKCPANAMYLSMQCKLHFIFFFMSIRICYFFYILSGSSYICGIQVFQYDYFPEWCDRICRFVVIRSIPDLHMEIVQRVLRTLCIQRKYENVRDTFRRREKTIE